MKASRSTTLSYEIGNTGIFVKAGTDMKRRIRTLVRQGWALVQVDPLREDQISEKCRLTIANSRGLTTVNVDHCHYKDLCDWCKSNVPDSDWTSSFILDKGTFDRGGSKRFVFKDHKFATWFKLMTLPDPTKSCD